MRRDGTDLNESERQKTRRVKWKKECEREKIENGGKHRLSRERQGENKTEGGRESKREREREEEEEWRWCSLISQV